MLHVSHEFNALPQRHHATQYRRVEDGRTDTRRQQYRDSNGSRGNRLWLIQR